MKRLIQFLYQYNAIFVFLILQIISLYLLVNFNKTHNIKYLSTIYSISKSYNEMISTIKNYFLLKEENKKLLKAYINLQNKITQLENKLEYYQNRVPLTSKLILQTDSNKVVYKYIPAKVIQNEVRSKFNYFIIDKGKKDGIEENIGVISETGIVGITKGVSDNFTSCVSILNSNVLVSVRILRNNVLGTLMWEGKNLSVGTVKYIPVHYNIQEGDIIVTSGLDNIFPPNIMVGKVIAIEHDKNEIGFVKLKVKFSTDFYKLNYVFVIKNSKKQEIDSLKNDIKAIYK